MNVIFPAPLAGVDPRASTLADRSSRAGRTFAAAGELLPFLERGQPIGSSDMRTVLTRVFEGSDAEGLWVWKDAYEACEVAQVLFLRKFGQAILAHSQTPSAVLAMLTKIAQLVPTHTRRSDESQALQQLSTPLPLAYVVGRAAGMIAGDSVLEPSAGTGLLAIFAELARTRLTLNDYAAVRRTLLEQFFPGIAVTQHDAAHIDDHLEPSVRPTVVVMNPPFSVGAHVEGRVSDAAWRHLSSAFARLAPGGRLVAITGSDLSPDNPKWRDAFLRLQEQGQVLFSAAIDGSVYARHGTTVDTRLTVVDKIPAEDPAGLISSRGKVHDVQTLLAWIGDLPPRSPSTAGNAIGACFNGILPAGATKMAVRRSTDTLGPAATDPAVRRRMAPRRTRPTVPATQPQIIVELAYETRAAETRSNLTEGIYEPYQLQAIHIPGAKPHPDKL